jgi:serine/threonine protein kinase
VKKQKNLAPLLQYGMRPIYPSVAGLHAMHSMQPPLVHRDIKSPNLLVGADDAVKIADFGLSRVQLLNATMTGQKGTWQWMAPEVLGSQRYAESADMYSFGVVVWELCCRDVPYRGMHCIQAAVAVMNHTLTLDVPAFAPPTLQSIMYATCRPLLHSDPARTNTGCDTV